MFKLKSKYYPTWDQPQSIERICNYLKKGYSHQTLWWVTWSWKTFVMANIIEKMKKPTLIIAHNKTLRAQLASEFKSFFPDARVHYFVSYYDYYQPEAYIWKTDTYIEKEATINEEIDRLRHAATQDLISRKDVIIVASVSCIYGVWDIKAYEDSIFEIKVWQIYVIEELIKNLLLLQYKRANSDFRAWTFIVHWDLVEIFPSSSETVLSIEFWWDEITSITRRNHITWEIYEVFDKVNIFPAKHIVTSKDTIERIIPQIREELEERLDFYKSINDLLKYERLKTKIEYDIEMMQEVWYVNWIENYSRYLDWRKPGEPPATLIDYFPKDFLCFIDESHITISQIRGMYAWDRARKENLVNAWFRLPSALDNRPLNFSEFERKISQMVLVSATPWEYDIRKSSKKWFEQKFFNFNPIIDWKWQDSDDCRIVPQVIRPTWLLDPVVKLRSMEFMVDDIMKNIDEIVKNNEKMLITTITKRSSEELCDYLLENWVKVKYLHSEIDTLERLEILNDLRTWAIDVIVWVNLLREWLDLPEVSKICILDADKKWFLRSTSSLIQIMWRARRNEKWTVYMYSEIISKFKYNDIVRPDNVWTYLIDDTGKKEELYIFDKWRYVNKDWLFLSNSMVEAINLTNYRRSIQKEYNIKNNIVPTTVFSEIKSISLKSKKIKDDLEFEWDLEQRIKALEFEMNVASSNTDFERARELRDQIIILKKKINKK